MESTHTWTVSRMLAAGFGLLIVAMLMLAGLGAVGQMKASAALHSLYADRAEPLRQLGHVRYLAVRDRVILADALQRGDAATIARRAKEFASNREHSAKLWKEYMATYLTPEEQELAARTGQALTAFESEALRPAFAALQAGRLDEGRALLLGKVSQLNPALSDGLDKLLELQVREAARMNEGNERLTATLQALMGAAVAAALIGSLVLAWWITRRLTRQLGAEPYDLAAAAARIARGELADDGRAAATPGSVLASMQAMRGALAQLVADVRGGVDQVASASGQIAQGNSDLAIRTEQQAANVQQTAASMEQLTGTVRAAAANARQASELAATASGTATQGGEVVSQVVATMGQIQHSSRRIAEIIGVIDGIAFQTNILALNAAVEAARAGEQGRGFAVVASEVRGLAQRSAAAAREIKALITESVQRVEDGHALVSRAGDTMRSVVDQVRSTAELLGQITQAAHEQTKGIEQIGDAVTQLDRNTQQNAALVEQSSAASESLKRQADTLAASVGRFSLA